MIAKPKSPFSARKPVSEAAASIGRNIAIVGLLAVASRLIGLVREVIIARQFGTSGEYDAYLAAFRIPDLLFLLIMTGSFGSAFIPVFRGLLDEDEDDAWRLASAVITWTALLVVAASVIVLLFADPIARHLVAPGLSPELQALSARIMRILLLAQLFIGMGIAAKGILETHHRFAVPGLAPLLYNLGIIFGALFLAGRWGVTGLAIGVVLGGLMHFVIQIPELLKVGLVYRPTLRRVAGLRDVAAMLGPRIIGQAAFQINFIVVTYMATREGEGKVSAINYAWAIMMLPNAVMGQSFGTVLFPTMTAQSERGDLDGLRETLTGGLRDLLFLAMPASIGLFAFREEIIRTIFESGAFSSASTELVVAPLAFFALALIFYSLVEVLARTFYAMRIVNVPVIAGVSIMIINVILAVWLTPKIGYAGLALALALSTAIEAIILVVALGFKLGRFDADFGLWFAKVGVASAVMAVVSLVMSDYLNAQLASGAIGRWFGLLFLGWAMALCGGLYGVTAYALRLPEVDRWLRIGRRALSVATAGRI
ncbi:MAG: murein biosynthesis integral membrane protein MurJ [Thermomicrobiales bacterium]|nr:murein biosynthesis integral membrane protein MurJ [Thermomicrobiales bacterium]